MKKKKPERKYIHSIDLENTPIVMYENGFGRLFPSHRYVIKIEISPCKDYLQAMFRARTVLSECISDVKKASKRRRKR